VPQIAVAFLTFLVILGSAGSLGAQTALPTPLADAANAGFQAPTASTWASQGRACDGCPPRRLGHAFLQTTYLNVAYELANLIRGQVTARITPVTWWANMQQGWVWDLDDFVVNQIGHPYQGNNYFNSGRANGLSYWESAGLTAFGSGTWEYFGETNHASLNDLINTTLGGMALGEMFHRTAWLLRDTQAQGRSRLWKEIAATAIDPVTGGNRFVTGDASYISDKPAELTPSALEAVSSAGALWRGSNTDPFQSSGEPFLEFNALYGDPSSGHSRTPYDAFRVLLRFGGGGPISEARVRGRLLGQPLRGGFQLNVTQDYDFNQNDAYKFGAQSFEMSVDYTAKLSTNTVVRTSGWGGLTALGAVDSLPVTGAVPEPPPGESGSDAGQGVSEGPRYYDYGPGGNFGGSALFTHNQRPFAAIYYASHQLYTLDGVRANHLLQQARVDVVAPLRGALGFGVSGEYFDRRTYYQDQARTIKKFHYPQFRAFLTWSVP
jgi:Domain of unknown function (DUF3943)